MKKTIGKLFIPLLAIVCIGVGGLVLAVGFSGTNAYALGDGLLSVTYLLEDPCEAHIYGGVLWAVLWVMSCVYLGFAFYNKEKKMSVAVTVFLPIVFILDIVVSCFPCCNGAIVFIVLNWVLTVLLSALFYVCDKAFLLGLVKKIKGVKTCKKCACEQKTEEVPAEKTEEVPTEKTEETPEEK